MRIAVTDLKDYNESILRYEWLDLEDCSSKDEIEEFIKEFLDKRTKETKELHEEWFVSDYEEFADFGEYPDIEDIAKAVELSKQYSWEAVAAYYGNSQELDSFEEAYSGVYEGEEDFAYETAQEIYSKEQLGVLDIYIDWEKYARDLFIGDYFSEKVENCNIAVFRRL